MRRILRDLITGTTRIINIVDDWGFDSVQLDAVECCKVGPIIDQCYCSKCGKRIVRK